MLCSAKVMWKQCKNEALPIGLCREHAKECRKTGCSGLTANSLCPDHECAHGRCIQPRVGRGDRCAGHGCELPIQHGGVSKVCGNARRGNATYCSEHLCAEPKCNRLHCLGPKCSIHGCCYKQEDDFCGKDLKQDSYFCIEHACHHADCGLKRAESGKYCPEHTCRADECVGQRIEHSEYCGVHKCPAEECFRVRGAGEYCTVHGCIEHEDGEHCGMGRSMPDSYYCERHVCAFKPCGNARDGRGECCAEHGCVYRLGGVACGVIKKEGSDYCTPHSCAIPDCGEKRVGEECCKIHGCRYAEPDGEGRCGRRMADSTSYCKDHLCTKPTCKSPRKGGLVCSKHMCKFKADEMMGTVCVSPREADLEWCAAHACPEKGCKKPNDGIRRCCLKHGCTSRVEGGGPCGEPRIPGRDLCDRHARPQVQETTPTEDEGPSVRSGPVTVRARPGMSREAMKRHLEQRLTESGLSCTVTGEDGLTFDDVVGLEDVKVAVRTAMVYPLQAPNQFRDTWANGILLFGPPGTGKTLVAEAAANELGGVMVSVDSAATVSSYVGKSEKNIRALFRIVTEHADATRKLVVLFMDEVDALLGSHQQEGEWNVKTRSEFQTNMSRIAREQKKVCVIGATNNPDRLAGSFRRRFHKRIYVRLPSENDIEKLFHMYTKGFEVDNGVDFAKIAKYFVGYSSSDIRDVCHDAYNRALAELYESHDGGPSGGASGKLQRPVNMNDFINVSCDRKSSVSQDELQLYEKWADDYGAL